MQKIRKALDATGILMLTDPALPSLISLVAGEPVKGSWWGHPKGNLMYNLSNELMDTPDVLAVKLFNGKITYLQQVHWNALYALATSQSDWQMKKMTPDMLGLLKRVLSKQELQTDDAGFTKTPTEIGKLATKLESRLLIFSENTHSSSGKHVRTLRTWKKQMALKKFKVKKMPVADAIAHFHQVIAAYTQNQHSLVQLPWA